MMVNGRNFDVDRAIHEVSMEGARIELQRLVKAKKIETDDISLILDRLFASYAYNFSYLARLSDSEIKKLLETD